MTNEVVEKKPRLQLMNVIHHNMNKWHRDWFGKDEAVCVVEKIHFPDGKQTKRVKIIDKPTVQYYLTAPEFQQAHTTPSLYFEQAKCEMYESPVNRLFLDIAKLTGQEAFYNETRGPGSGRRRKLLHGHRWLHGSDVNLGDSYIDRYMVRTQQMGVLDTTAPLNNAFGDIEVDIIDHVGFPEEDEAPCPIWIHTYFYRPTQVMTLFISRVMVRENPQVKQFEDNWAQNRIRLLADMNRPALTKVLRKGKKKFDPIFADENVEWEAIAGALGFIEDERYPFNQEAYDRIRVKDLKASFFNSEKELILGYLHHINEVDRPDTMSYWNMRFDIKTIYNRLMKLGVNPDVAFTPKDFGKWCMASYNEDRFSIDPTECNDAFDCTSYTIYNDQMLLYAKLRKGGGKKNSYALDAILKEELDESKFEYEGELYDLPYRDYFSAVKYACLDVSPMAALEDRVEDLAQAYQLSMTTRTRYHHILKKTTCLRNLAADFFRRRGFVLSNNRNRLKDRTDSEKFRGAFVADPMLMEATGVLIEGMRSNRIFDNATDFDAKSLYPSIMRAWGIDETSQLGILLMETFEGDLKKIPELIEAIASGDQIAIGKAWFNLPGMGEIIQDLVEYESAEQ